jgi:hypothetical protein
MRDYRDNWMRVGLSAGTKLRVMLCGTEEITTGILLNIYHPKLMRNDWDIGFNMPKIRLKDGRIVYGSQCWWLPLKLALKAEKELKAHELEKEVEAEIVKLKAEAAVTSVEAKDYSNPFGQLPRPEGQWLASRQPFGDCLTQ